MKSLTETIWDFEQATNETELFAHNNRKALDATRAATKELAETTSQLMKACNARNSAAARLAEIAKELLEYCNGESRLADAYLSCEKCGIGKFCGSHSKQKKDLAARRRLIVGAAAGIEAPAEEETIEED